MSGCIFCKIAAGEIPSKKIYEDEDIFAFHDINPARPVHFLMIPKRHVGSLYDADASYQAVLGKMLLKAADLARKQGLNEGFRTIVNTGRIGGQEVYHLHIHIMGGPEPVGPMVLRV
ncbi:Protein HitA [Georgfuchsia toluolica]|uniref:Protein HitA n=1 Tax=Georgfuchsia toluolica TaxID=424218 RepID=A0A916J4Q4_9PROT|nr:histidine triad nucleotide-binding protein [Georgfuchsia toluolica]CAG4883953.1 Protein HitA [Georgfuchsia toluolica]